MSVFSAYISVILIWSTTPLAIKWSGDGPGFLFGVSSRMIIGALLCLLVVRLLRMPFPWHAQARQAYLAAGFGIYAAMLSVYWGAQYIPSGLISVIFGLTPLVTGLIAAYIMGNEKFGLMQMLGTILGLAGLAVIFADHLHAGAKAPLGIAAVSLSVLLHSISSVRVKSLSATMSPLAITAGGLLIAAPLYFLTWWVLDGHWPQHIPLRAGASIAYLSAVGSVLGFMLYFYMLKHLDAGRVALITLMTPVLALLIGYRFNGETIGREIIYGTALILSGLLAHQWQTVLQSFSRSFQRLGGR